MKQFWLILGISLLSLIYICLQNQERRLPRVVFCDVGQGDAIYFRLPEGLDVLIDAGAYSEVLRCLNRELPYFDRTLELAFITHPEKDHYGGFLAILENFRVKQLFLPLSLKELRLPESNQWVTLLEVLERKRIPVEFLQRGQNIQLEKSTFTVLAPSKSTVNLSQKTPAQELNLNNLGLGLLASVQNTQLLLLADLDAPLAEEALTGFKAKIDILKLNHHGSKYGLSEKMLTLAEPRLAVLSVGEKNFYGHPHEETLALLLSHKIPLRRTDKEEEVEILLH